MINNQEYRYENKKVAVGMDGKNKVLDEIRFPKPKKQIQHD